MFELSYDGICSFQYAVLEGEVEGERLRSRLRTGFKDQPRLINILLLNYWKYYFVSSSINFTSYMAREKLGEVSKDTNINKWYTIKRRNISFVQKKTISFPPCPHGRREQGRSTLSLLVKNKKNDHRASSNLRSISCSPAATSQCLGTCSPLTTPGTLEGASCPGDSRWREAGPKPGSVSLLTWGFTPIATALG